MAQFYLSGIKNKAGVLGQVPRLTILSAGFLLLQMALCGVEVYLLLAG